ncbi:MAG: NAD-dependent protein deacylase [Erysipelotrichaceae bacterium]|nr:NAD-dependent protein deacylase [Erysipelotrichaceae bacterium]
MDAIEQLRKWVNEAQRIVFFGGAGVSTESGIPDFRSANGIFQQEYAYRPEEIVSHSFFLQRPKEFYEFYKERMVFPEALPNITHQVLSDWEKQGKQITIVTQNIDGLHQKAGSERVIELHGSVLRNYCTKCGKFYDVDAIMQQSGVPHCECGGMIKPDVVLYEEPLKEQDIQQALSAIQHADLLIVAGTSLSVYPAAGMIRYFRGDHLVLINKTVTDFDRNADLLLHQSLGSVFSKLQ